MKSSKKGFTLIELLVVIAIIAILAAILFPVFAAARKRAKLTACLSNMKQIGLGIIMNANDHQDQLPVYGTECGFEAYCYRSQLPWTKQLKPYVKSAKVFRCPIDTSINAPITTNYYWDVFAGRPLWAQTGFAPENFKDFEANGDGKTEKTPKPNTSIGVYCKDHTAPGTSYTYSPDCSGKLMTSAPSKIRAAAQALLDADPTDVKKQSNPNLRIRSAADVEVCRDVWYWHLGTKVADGNYRPKLWLDGHVSITQEMGPRFAGTELYN